MNKTKFSLIVVAIIFSFVDVAWQIYQIVQYFLTDIVIRDPVFYVVLDFITIVQSLAVAVLLIIAVWNKGKLFKKRYGLYMTAIMLSIIINLFSISSILLITTMFISDWVLLKPEQQGQTVVEVSQDSIREDKIAQLRIQREKGEISEKEFEEKLMELL